MRSLNLIFYESVDYNHLFDGSLSTSQKRRVMRDATMRVDSFIMNWLLKSVMIELDDLLNPGDTKLLMRLISRLEQMIPGFPWARIGKIFEQLKFLFISFLSLQFLKLNLLLFEDC